MSDSFLLSLFNPDCGICDFPVEESRRGQRLRFKSPHIRIGPVANCFSISSCFISHGTCPLFGAYRFASVTLLPCKVPLRNKTLSSSSEYWASQEKNDRPVY
ncbi:hypothetical protein GDO78_021471 [Eleutherodactylus coqui]|uniref:Uncharacterized protein n=1 Tax=Eleutherodactylus coqui TaxID=57060 RepID=A0A8J6B931_ELECQ|nr:hypothetical protein GDO78_021471 [Eleutherodactylus coqui]